MPETPKKNRKLLSFSNPIQKRIKKGTEVGKKALQKIPFAGKRIIPEKMIKEEVKSPEEVRKEELNSKSWIKLILASEMRYHLPLFALIVLGFGLLAYLNEPDLILFLSFGFTCGYAILGILALSNRVFQEYLSGIQGVLVGGGLTVIGTIIGYLRIDIDSMWFFAMGFFLLWTCLQAHFFAVLVLGISEKLKKYIYMHIFLLVLCSLCFSLIPFIFLGFLSFIGLDKSSKENEIDWMIFCVFGLLLNLIFLLRNTWILNKSKDSKQLWFRVFFFHAIFLSYLLYRGFSLISNYQKLPPFPEVRWIDLIIMILTIIVATKAFSEKSIQFTAGSFDLPPTSAAFFGFALTSTYAAGQFWLFTEWKDPTRIFLLSNTLILISGLIVLLLLFKRFSIHERQMWKQQEKRLKTSLKLQAESRSIRNRIEKLRLKHPKKK